MKGQWGNSCRDVIVVGHGYLLVEFCGANGRWYERLFLFSSLYVGGCWRASRSSSRHLLFVATDRRPFFGVR